MERCKYIALIFGLTNTNGSGSERLHPCQLCMQSFAEIKQQSIHCEWKTVHNIINMHIYYLVTVNFWRRRPSGDHRRSGGPLWSQETQSASC